MSKETRSFPLSHQEWDFRSHPIFSSRTVSHSLRDQKVFTPSFRLPLCPLSDRPQAQANPIAPYRLDPSRQIMIPKFMVVQQPRFCQGLQIIKKEPINYVILEKICNP